MGLTLEFPVGSLSPEPFERFSLNFGLMLISVRQCAEPILSYQDSRSHYKIMEVTLEFGVPSISPEPFQRNSFNFAQMFLSVRQCEEVMT